MAGAGTSMGRLLRADERLESAANRSVLERERLEEEGPVAWEDRVARPELEPWAPAESLTNLSDLARALWARGRDGEFPEPGDLLTVRDEEGRVLSSFGTMRPGDEGRGTAVGLRVPVPGTFGVLSRAPWPDGDEEDPLLVGVLQGAANPALLVNWTLLISFLVGHRILPPGLLAAGVFAVGVGIGVFAWFAILVELVERLKRHPAGEWIHNSAFAAGVLLIGFGLYFSWRTVAEFVSGAWMP